MTVQTSVLAAPVRGYEGQIADSAPRYSRSAAAQGAIVAGQPVLRGTNPSTQVVPVTNGATLNAATIAGLALLDTSRPVGGIPDKAPCTVLVSGTAYVRVSATVVAGTAVFVGTATAQLGDIGNTGTGMTTVPGWKYEESGVSGDIVQISLNLRA